MAEEYMLGKIRRNHPGGTTFRSGETVAVVGMKVVTTKELIPQRLTFYKIVELDSDRKPKNHKPFLLRLEDVIVLTEHTV